MNRNVNKPSQDSFTHSGLNDRSFWETMMSPPQLAGLFQVAVAARRHHREKLTSSLHTLTSVFSFSATHPIITPGNSFC